MKRVDFCRLVLQSSINADPCGSAVIERELQDSKAIYDNFKPEERTVSDLDPFSKPHTDSRNLHSSIEQNVNTVFAGIDTETPELRIVDRLNEKGAAVDAVCVYLLYIVGSLFILVFRGLSGLG